MNAPAVRPARTADVPDVAQVWQAAWHDGHHGHVPEALAAARDEAYFAVRARALVGSTLVAEAPDGGLLGLVITRADELQQLMVDARARGGGVGDALLAAAERRIAADHPAAWLAVVPGNRSARRFYERRGWRDHGEETYLAVTLAEERVPVTVCRYVKVLA